jgi:integrase
MRHTFASRLARAGVSLLKIARWMGHTHTYVTEMYAHLCPDDRDIERMK